MILLSLIAIPVIYAIAMKVWLHKNIDFLEMVVLLVVAAGVGVGLHQVGKYHAMSDTEIWNGRVTGKERSHGHYVESYDCNCRTETVGYGENRRKRRVCQTCYRDHYTAVWDVYSTVGTIRIHSIDVTSRFRRDSYPDPREFTAAFKGEPASVANSYVNYVKAAEYSLLNRDASLAEKLQKKGLIPNYPSIHNYYDVDHVLVSGGVPSDFDLESWNDTAGKMLAHLGPAKQMNFVVVIVDYGNPNYIHALEAAWQGAKKNDAIIAIGVTDYPTIDWVRVLSWSKNDMFNVLTRNSIMEVGELNKNAVLGAIQEAALGHFERRPMEEFEYLEDEIDPPIFITIMAYLLMILSSIGLGFLFHRIDLGREVVNLIRR